MKKLLALILVGAVFACSESRPGADIPLDRSRDYAVALYNQKLFPQAISEYSRILETYSLSDEERAKYNYRIGNIYFENLGDYTNAMTYYLKIRSLFPESSIIDEVDKRYVASLERLGKSKEAAAVLKQTTSLKDEGTPLMQLEGDTLATVGGTVITSGDFERLFTYFWNSQPPEVRKEEPTREQKITFLRDYVKGEALYNSAKLQQLDQAKEVIEVAYLQKKQLMVQKYLEKEVNSTIVVTEEEIKKFYEENKSKLTIEKDGKQVNPTLQEAHDDIEQLIFMQEAQQKQAELTDKLIEAQNAKLFIDKIKE
ncbi:tol-pal system YbgF family protein [candidate division KSB1 bacterium]